MSHPIPEDAQRLARRLRMLADEVESAARYGVPICHIVSASGHEYGHASMSLTPEEFDAWADYTEATVEEYDYADQHWRTASVEVNGLPLVFSASASPVEGDTDE